MATMVGAIEASAFAPEPQLSIVTLYTEDDTDTFTLEKDQQLAHTLLYY
jgi:hypothetical protein